MEIEKSTYDNVTRIKALCHLRNAERTSQINRIQDITIFETQTLCFSLEPYHQTPPEPKTHTQSIHDP